MNLLLGREGRRAGRDVQPGEEVLHLRGWASWAGLQATVLSEGQGAPCWDAYLDRTKELVPEGHHKPWEESLLMASVRCSSV